MDEGLLLLNVIFLRVGTSGYGLTIVRFGNTRSIIVVL